MPCRHTARSVSGPAGRQPELAVHCTDFRALPGGGWSHPSRRRAAAPLLCTERTCQTTTFYKSKGNESGRWRPLLDGCCMQLKFSEQGPPWCRPSFTTVPIIKTETGCQVALSYTAQAGKEQNSSPFPSLLSCSPRSPKTDARRKPTGKPKGFQDNQGLVLSSRLTVWPYSENKASWFLIYSIR